MRLNRHWRAEQLAKVKTPLADMRIVGALTICEEAQFVHIRRAGTRLYCRRKPSRSLAGQNISSLRDKRLP